MERAGWSYENRRVRLADIGLLVYTGEKDPKIYRTSQIPTDATYIRPFMVFDCPGNMPHEDYSSIRFNLSDSRGKLRYTSRRRYTLKPGPNFITPPTWLPLVGQQVGETWHLDVIAGQVPLGSHYFRWQTAYQPVPMTGDGEIDEEAQQWLAQQAEEPMSLDELLALQAEADGSESLARGGV
jgi:hypothetical protein